MDIKLKGILWLPRKIIFDAKSLEQAGVFSIVLEMVTDEVTEIISKSTAVPVIGIGSGNNCDGQVPRFA